MNHLGIEQVVRFGKRAYRLSRLTRGVLRKWLVWAEEKLPLMEELLKGYGDLPPSAQTILLRQLDAYKPIRGTLADPIIGDLYCTAEGQLYLFFLLFDLHHPDVTFRTASRIATRIDLAEVFLRASGRNQADEAEVEAAYYRELGIVPYGPSEGKPKGLNWAEFDRNIFQNFNILPNQLDLLTIPEIVTIATKKAESNMSEAMATIENFRKLTVEQQNNLLLRCLLS